jgi:hypothetical protein
MDVDCRRQPVHGPEHAHAGLSPEDTTVHKSTATRQCIHLHTALQMQTDPAQTPPEKDASPWHRTAAWIRAGTRALHARGERVPLAAALQLCTVEQLMSAMVCNKLEGARTSSQSQEHGDAVPGLDTRFADDGAGGATLHGSAAMHGNRRGPLEQHPTAAGRRSGPAAHPRAVS